MTRVTLQVTIFTKIIIENGGIGMTLVQEAYSLIQKQPEENIKLIIELLKKLNTGSFTIEDILQEKKDNENIYEGREIGFLSDDFISISPDFDICLDGLEDYV